MLQSYVRIGGFWANVTKMGAAKTQQILIVQLHVRIVRASPMFVVGWREPSFLMSGFVVL